MPHTPIFNSHCHFSTGQTATIASGTTSNAIDIRNVNAGCAVFSDEFDSDSITFLVSLDGENYYALASTTLSPASGPVTLALPSALFNWGWFKYVTNVAVSASTEIPTGLKSGV